MLGSRNSDEIVLFRIELLEREEDRQWIVDLLGSTNHTIRRNFWEA